MQQRRSDPAEQHGDEREHERWHRDFGTEERVAEHRSSGLQHRRGIVGVDA
jgi:hypothetical protein